MAAKEYSNERITAFDIDGKAYDWDGIVYLGFYEDEKVSVFDLMEQYANHQTASLREKLEKVRDHAVTLTNEKEELEAKIEKAAAEGYSFGRADAETEIEDSLREEIEQLKKENEDVLKNLKQYADLMSDMSTKTFLYKRICELMTKEQ